MGNWFYSTEGAAEGAALVAHPVLAGPSSIFQRNNAILLPNVPVRAHGHGAAPGVVLS